MGRKKTEIEVTETDTEITEDIEMTDNEDAYESGSEEQDREEFLEDHELDAMSSDGDLGEFSGEEPEEDPVPVIIYKMIEGPWRVRCPFFSYKDESDAREGLELECTYHGIISLQTSHDSLEDVVDTTQRFCFGNFAECESYKEIFETMLGLEGYENLKVCGQCCNASLAKEDLRNPNSNEADERCHCMHDGIDHFRFMSVKDIGDNGCAWYNRYLDGVLESEETAILIPSQTNLSDQRTPDVIASEINAIKTQTIKTVLMNSITIGGKLTEAKEMIGHGNWGNWLADKVNYSQDTAENLMKLFREYGPRQLDLFGSVNSETFRNLGYSQALALCAIPADEREGFVQGNDVGRLSVRQLQCEIDKYKAKVQEAENRANNLDWKARNCDFYQKRSNDMCNENYNLRQKLREATGSEPERVEVMPGAAVKYITDNLEEFFENLNNDLPDKKVMQLYVDAYKDRHSSAAACVVMNIDELVESLKEIVGWMKELAPDCYEWSDLEWCGYSSEESNSDDGDE